MVCRVQLVACLVLLVLRVAYLILLILPLS